jgi:hypothetical protein
MSAQVDDIPFGRDCRSHGHQWAGKPQPGWNGEQVCKRHGCRTRRRIKDGKIVRYLYPKPKPLPTAADAFTALLGYRTMTRAQLVALVEQMATDWRILNDIHNQSAQRNNWCGEYEDRQYRHNQSFRVLKLVGRNPGIQRGMYGHTL